MGGRETNRKEERRGRRKREGGRWVRKGGEGEGIER